MADHPRRRALPRLHARASASPTPGTPTRGSRRRSPAQAQKLLHGQQNILYHEPGPAAVRPAPEPPSRRPVPGVPVELGRRGHRGVGQAGASGDRPARRSSRSATATTAGRPRRWRSRPPRTSTAAPSSRCPGSVYHTAYPYCYRAAGGPHDPSACTCDWEEQLDLTFHQFIYPDRVAAIIIEPVLGEGGYIVPPPDFLPRLREITRRHGILLIADEVQTGFGRTGQMFAVHALRRRAGHPGHGQGHRVGAAAVGDPGPPGADGAPGSPAPTAARTAATSCRARPPTRRSTSSRTRASSANAARARRAVPGRAARHCRRSTARIGDVRGLGLMVALELVKPDDGDGRVPDPDLTKRIQAEALDAQADRPDRRAPT